MMTGAFVLQYNITMGSNQQERLHAMKRLFVVQCNTGAFSSAVMTGHDRNVCSTL